MALTKPQERALTHAKHLTNLLATLRDTEVLSIQLLRELQLLSGVMETIPDVGQGLPQLQVPTEPVPPVRDDA